MAESVPSDVPSSNVPPDNVPSSNVPSSNVPPDRDTGRRRHRRNPLIYFWVYSLARVSLFLGLWGLLWLFGLGGLIGAAVALVLSVPLSYVFLARPRMAMTAAMMERLNVRQERTAELDQKLSGVEDHLDPCRRPPSGYCRTRGLASPPSTQ